VQEAEVLSGRRIQSGADLKDAARRIHDMGVAAIIITGGHREDSGSDVVDTFFDGHNFSEFRTPRLGNAETHGTGCTFAAAVAAHLALGRTLAEAAELAQQYVAGAIRRSIAIGKGGRVLGHL
jgi:hydroxymethylpyrimidine/phosphomethylpyrimidine kinase